MPSPDRVLVWNEAQKQEANRAAAYAEGQDRRHRRAYLRSLVHLEAVDDARRIHRPCRPRSGAALYALSRLVAASSRRTSRPSCCTGRRRCANSGDPLLKRSRHPDPAASAERGPWTEVDVSRPRQCRGPSARRLQSGQPRREGGIFRLHVSLRLVVGVNTSGMIEAGILGKPVHTVLFEEIAGTQEGTLHFHHLSDDSRAASCALLATWRSMSKLLGRARRPDRGRAPQQGLRRAFRPADGARCRQHGRMPSSTAVEAQLRGPAPRRNGGERRRWCGVALARCCSSPAAICGGHAARRYSERAALRRRRKRLSPDSPQRRRRRNEESSSSSTIPATRAISMSCSARILRARPSGARRFRGTTADRGPRGARQAASRISPSMTWTFRGGAQAADLRAKQLRGTTDYIRYLDPLYKDSPYLRQRTEGALPAGFRFLAKMPTPAEPDGQADAARRWSGREAALPSAADVEDYLPRSSPTCSSSRRWSMSAPGRRMRSSRRRRSAFRPACASPVGTI